MDKLKPCPFCGSTKLKIDSKRTPAHKHKIIDGNFYSLKHCSVTVRCNKCNARSPVVGIDMLDGQYNERTLLQNAAIEAWNRRTDNGFIQR